jgi:ATP-dependent DNA helicase DinG
VINLRVLVEVQGKTYPHRVSLKKNFNLTWDNHRKQFHGQLLENSPRFMALVQFCERFNLRIAVEGAFLEIDNELEVDSDIGTEGGETQEGLGKIGQETLPEGQRPGFKIVEITEDFDIKTDMSDYFENTRFNTPRKIQLQTLSEVTECIKEGYKNIIVECPTGSGKSALAMMIPKIFGEYAYISTHLKGLQKQYMEEMPFMRSMMGRANYTCKLPIEPGTYSKQLANEALEQALQGNIGTSCDASAAPCKTIGAEFKCSFKLNLKDYDESQELCDYYDSLSDARNSRYFISNVSYLMALHSAAPGVYLPSRPFLVVDEAHNLIKNMMSQFSIDLSLGTLERLFHIPKESEDANQRNKMLTSWSPNNPSFGFPKVPSITTKTDERIWQISARVWEAYLSSLRESIIQKIEDEDYSAKELNVANNYKQRLSSILRFINKDWKNWVWQFDNDKDPFKISFKPLKVNEYAEELMLSLGDKRVFLSATILDADTYCNEMGLLPEETAFIRVKYSPFPSINRPILTKYIGGNLSHRSINEVTLGKTVERIVEIANENPNEKGLILPYTNILENQLVEIINESHPLVAARLVQHTKDSHERDSTFKHFNNSKGNEILISTYANQGYDGKTVGFLIVPKVPFQPLGDVQVKKKMEANPRWYKVMAAMELTQMLGRIVRSETDTGKMYILDPNFRFHWEVGFDKEPLRNFMPDYLNRTIEESF